MKNLIWLVTLAVCVVSSVAGGQSTDTVMNEAENGSARSQIVIPDGMRAFPVRVDSIIGNGDSVLPRMRSAPVKVNGIIGDEDSVLPGTRVDIIRPDMPPNDSEEDDSRIILENILVLACGLSRQQNSDSQPQNVSVVVLLVTSEQAQKLTLAKSDGIQLAVRK